MAALQAVFEERKGNRIGRIRIWGYKTKGKCKMFAETERNGQEKKNEILHKREVFAM
ncbi:MAG: hypothetical protein HFG66_14405 [Hungatella sp.]|jgi:hypothetical protein|nr:hypothetical protein [Hungatella sp.]